jgi:hypothetical protein
MLGPFSRKTLFIYFRSPLPPAPLLLQPKAVFLIKVPRSVKPFESPEIDTPEPLDRTMIERGREKATPNAASPRLVRGDEPPQMRTFSFRMGTVNRDRAFNASVCNGEPQAILTFDVSFAELRELASDLAFEVQAEASVPCVEMRMHFCDPTDAAWQITLVNRD